MSTDVMMGIILLVLANIIASIFYPILAGGAGHAPTPRRIVAEALGQVGLRKDEAIYDIGCGIGGAQIEASKLCNHVRGVEIEPVRWFLAKLRARKARVILGNLFRQDISDADVAFIFQFRGNINNRIAMKIKAGTRSGTRIVSFDYPLENMNLVKIQDGIFIYET